MRAAASFLLLTKAEYRISTTTIWLIPDRVAPCLYRASVSGTFKTMSVIFDNELVPILVIAMTVAPVFSAWYAVRSVWSVSPE